MKKKIEVDHGTKKRIMKALRCTYPTVKNALENKSNTVLAKQIRQYAMQNGGVEYSVN